MQKIRIIGFFFENRLHWKFEVKKILQTAILGYIFIYVQMKYFADVDRQLSPLTWTSGIPCLIWESRRSTSCVPRSRNCIICVPRWRLQVYQLRPELLTPNMTSCVPRLVRNCISCIER